MPETALAGHVDCDEVARLVAARTAEIEQAFAFRTARILLDMCPPVHDNETWVATASLESAARVTLRLAGLNPEQNRMVPNDPRRDGTNQDHTGAETKR